MNSTDSRDYSGTIGFPLPSTDVLLLDEQGQPVAMGEQGELAVKGPQVMSAYWNQPEETANVFTPNGFLKTGDIGVMDQQGRIRLVDRKKDMILVSGFNVYPNEIEDVVAAHPDVLEVAAVGVPSEHSGESIKLFVVKRNPSLTEADIKQWCKERLTAYKRPRIIEFRDELPRAMWARSCAASCGMSKSSLRRRLDLAGRLLSKSLNLACNLICMKKASRFNGSLFIGR